MELYHSSELANSGSTSKITPRKGKKRCLTISPMRNFASLGVFTVSSVFLGVIWRNLQMARGMMQGKRAAAGSFEALVFNSSGARRRTGRQTCPASLGSAALPYFCHERARGLVIAAAQENGRLCVYSGNAVLRPRSARGRLSL